MRFTNLALVLANVPFLVLSTPVETRAVDVLQDLQDQAMTALREAEGNRTLDSRSSSCSIFNAAIRKDWAIMSSKERLAYTSAVQCLLDLPSKSDPELVPGAKNRFDDFVGQHINQTRTIHGTGNFLSWHRQFLNAYEVTLREECGYKGYQPYWNWFTHQNNLKKHPVFDGSATSMGGDGEFVAHNGSVGGAGKIHLPSGEGGGCIKSGPFKGLIANLGPVQPTMAGQEAASSALAYNPRCLKRDLTTAASSGWLTIPNLLNITVGQASKNIETFQDELQGGPSRFAQGFLSLHAAGHFAIGGDAGDFFSSPVDPAFFLHHAMLDRVWWLWQALHLNQANTVAGTRTMFDPTGPATTKEDLIEMNYINVDTVQISDVLNTLGGSPLCYVYL